MAWWESEEQKAQRLAARERLKVEARKLLVAIGAELTARGHTVSYPEKSREPLGSSRYPMIAIDGVQIPLWIEQSSKMGGYHLTEHDYLAVTCNWVYEGYKIWLKSKTFGRSATKRAETFGFDVPKIADHLELWAKTMVEATQRTKLRDAALEQWERVVELLVLSGAPEDRVSAESGGIRIKLPLLDQKTAERVLAAVDPVGFRPLVKRVGKE